MKKVINGKMYSTETAECVGKWDNGCWGGFDLCAEALYRKRTGEFFLHGDGGARSKYAKQYDKFGYGGQQIIPLSEREAREWAEEHLNGDEYEEIFGIVEDDESQATITVSISAHAMDCGQRAATERGISLPALIDALLSNSNYKGDVFKMNMQNNMPVWMRAFYGWADQMMREWRDQTQCDPDEVGMSHCEDESREFVANMDWNICKYCLGPCGECKEKKREQPCCDPCPQDVHGVTECTYCPITMFKKLHGMRFTENK